MLISLHKAEDVHIRELVEDISAQSKVCICTEDFAKTNRSVLDKLLVTLPTRRPTNLQSLLNTLTNRYPVLSWVCVEGIIIIRPAALTQYRENPLQIPLAQFQFEGSILDLEGCFATKIPGLLYAWGGNGGKVRKDYKLKFKDSTTMEQVLARLSRQYGNQWNVTISDEIASSPNMTWIGFFIGESPETLPVLLHCGKH
jgi:hypothetical protein